MLKKSLSVIILIIVVLSGCTFLSFFDKTEFSVHCTEIIDYQGFPVLSLTVNTSDRVTVRLINSLNRIIFSEEIFKGYQTIDVFLDSYWTSPYGGSFYCNVRDKNGNKIFENEYFFSNQNLSIVSVDQHWWHTDDTFHLVGLSLMVFNNGDLPAYPSSLVISVDGKKFTSKVLPTLIFPHDHQMIHCVFYGKDFDQISDTFTVSLFDSKDTLLAEFTDNIDKETLVSEVSYTWQYKRKAYSLTLPEINFLYSYYAGLDRVRIDDYAFYSLNIFDKQYLNICVQYLNALTEGFDDIEVISFIASFVQQLKYAADDPDDPTFEYPQYPIETIYEGQGDCEDMAILTTSLLSVLGYDVALIRVPQHMAVGVKIHTNLSLYEYFADEYYFLETTRLGWQLGRIPDEYKNIDNFTIFPVVDRPVLYHSWKNATRLTSTDSSDFVKLSIILENLGSAAARDCRVAAVFVNDNDTVLNKEIVDVSFIDVLSKKIVDISIDVPVSVSSHLKTIVYLDSIQVHERVSLSVFP